MRKYNDNKTHIINYFHRYLSRPSYVKCKDIKLCADKNKLSKKVIKSFHKESYERDERDVLLSTLSPNDRYLEIGAGVGYMGINAAKIVKSDDQIFLFEANPEMVEVIKTNLELNDKNLPVFNKAIISSNDEKIPFYLTKDFWISSTLNKKNTRKIIIDALPLENVLKMYKPTYLMVDAEGGEYDLFTNCAMSKSVRKICFEIHPKFISSEKITAIFNVLISEGFTIDFSLSRKHAYYMYR